MFIKPNYGKFDIMENGFLIETCTTREAAHEFLGACGDDHIADFEGNENEECSED